MLERIILSIIDQISYFTLFILFFLEGPIVNFIASALSATTDKFNIFVIVFLAIAGDTLGDIMYFMIGRKVNLSKLKKRLKFIKKSKTLVNIIKKSKSNLFLFLFTIKIFSITAVPGIIYLGHKKTNMKKFIYYTAILALLFEGTVSLVAYNLIISLKTFIAYRNFLDIMGVALVIGMAILISLRFVIELILKKDLLDKK